MFLRLMRTSFDPSMQDEGTRLIKEIAPIPSPGSRTWRAPHRAWWR